MSVNRVEYSFPATVIDHAYTWHGAKGSIDLELTGFSYGYGEEVDPMYVRVTGHYDLGQKGMLHYLNGRWDFRKDA